MFFLRCAFWLSIMYVGISFGVGTLRSPHAFETAVASQASALGTGVVARASDWCAERPGQCVRDAARLTALVETAAAEPAAGEDVVLSDAEAPRVPLPAPAPRHHAGAAVLTDAR